ncbi:MAG: HAMP domain-containing protein, partial [Curvibacter sp.]
MEKEQQAYLKALEALIAQEEAQMEASAVAVEGAARQALLQTVAVLLLAVLAALGLALGLMRSIQRPLLRAGRLARAVAAGDLTLRADARGRDEVSALLATLGEMQVQ